MSQVHSQYALDLTFKAASDLSALQYFPVKAGATAGTCDVVSGTGNDVVLGILQNKPTANQEAVVRIFGPSKAAVNGNTDVAVRDWLEAGATASGALVGGVQDQDNVVGFALEAQTVNANDVVEIFVLPGTASL